MTINHDNTSAEIQLRSNSLESGSSSDSFESEDRARARAMLEGSFLLTQVALNQGDIQGAIDCLDRLLQFEPDNLGVLIEKGALLYRIGNAKDAAKCFQAARRIAPEDELVLTNLAVTLADSGKRHEAIVEFRRIVELYPANLYVQHQLRRLTSAIVPFWHVRMLNDAKRNDAFESAIRAALEKEGRHARILDIGAGSGLLSMMAARAGATNVVSCEKEPAIAEKAEHIVALNGFERQIRIISKDSNQIALGKDIDARADILISEIISSDLLAENVLDTFQDAHSRLLRKDATVIPRAATAMGCLVASDVLHKYAFVDEVSGFDVSPFTTLSPLRLPVHGTMESWRRLSDDIDLVRIDLTAKKHEGELRKVILPVLDDGEAVGVIQWLDLDLFEGIRFSNHPDSYSDGGWLQVLHTFPRPISVARGEQFELMVGHDRASLIVAPATGARVSANPESFHPRADDDDR